MKKSDRLKAKSIVKSTCRSLFLLSKEAILIWRKQGILRAVIFIGKLTVKINETLNSFLETHYREFGRNFPQLRRDHWGEIEGGYSQRLLAKLVVKVSGLHQYLQSNSRIKFSVFIPVLSSEPVFFERTLRSALRQSAPEFEILVGFSKKPSPEIQKTIEKLKSEFPEKAVFLKSFVKASAGDLDKTTAIINEMALKATGTHFLLMDQEDWIRPDLMFRYQLTLDLMKDSTESVLYCNEYQIDQEDEILDGTYIHKCETQTFPYFFMNSVGRGLCVPEKYWRKAGGLRIEAEGAHFYDLCLRLDLAGARFVNVPFHLYASRPRREISSKVAESKPKADQAGLKCLQDYARQKHLNWQIEPGLYPGSYRARPQSLNLERGVHVIIPFKDQKQMTLNAVRSVLNQKSVRIHISAMDNGSQDQSIADELRKLGVEVIRAPRPFNYSYLNNQCLRESIVDSSQFPYVLFLNNDVCLDSSAVMEMMSWIEEDRIGIVGARLHYENGTLQHGGVQLGHGNSRIMNWNHRELGRKFEDLVWGRTLGVCDAVTAACLLMKRSTFEKVGGFDEFWYPISFSDTDLCRKVRRLGLLCFYTPYAFGTHFESASRGYEDIEDFEASTWLFSHTERRFSKVQWWSDNHIFDRETVLCDLKPEILDNQTHLN